MSSVYVPKIDVQCYGRRWQVPAFKFRRDVLCKMTLNFREGFYIFMSEMKQRNGWIESHSISTCIALKRFIRTSIQTILKDTPPLGIRIAVITISYHRGGRRSNLSPKDFRRSGHFRVCIGVNSEWDALIFYLFPCNKKECGQRHVYEVDV
jgi:hypothetical protein